MNERIKKLRKALDLTQQEFADKIGMKRNTIASYEINRNGPSNSVISLICKTFHVSETWLRTGEGEMFVELPENEALAAQIQSFLQGGTDSFRERLVSLLIRLPPEHWEALEGYLLELMAPRTASAASVLSDGADEEAMKQKAGELYMKEHQKEDGPDAPASSVNGSAVV